MNISSFGRRILQLADAAKFYSVTSLFSTANTWTAIQTFSANPSVTGGAISFPATQVPSAGANDLDDYEEGTFTPRIDGTTTAGAGTYSAQSGAYTKIGRQVTVKGNMTWSAHTGTGNMRIANLPFTSASDGIATPINLSYSDLTFANAVLGVIPSAVTTVTLGTAGTGAAFTQLPIDTAATLNFSGTYFV